MNEALPTLVPATLHRIRCFLNAAGGTAVRPWAPAAEILDAFHDALRARCRDDVFWKNLESLLESLVDDMRRRTAAGASRPFDAGALDPERLAAVLAEIRSALGRRRRGAGRFGRLARAVSAPAVAVLVLLGGVATLGCYDSHADQTDSGSETDVATDAGADSDARPDTPADAPRDDAAADADAAPDSADDADVPCDPDGATLEQILIDCGYDEPGRAEIIECVDALHASWRPGLTDLFACAPCWEVTERLQVCLVNGGGPTCGGYCREPGDAGTFDEETFLANCCMLVYLGVRFE